LQKQQQQLQEQQQQLNKTYKTLKANLQACLNSLEESSSVKFIIRLCLKIVAGSFLF